MDFFKVNDKFFSQNEIFMSVRAWHFVIIKKKKPHPCDAEIRLFAITPPELRRRKAFSVAF